MPTSVPIKSVSPQEARQMMDSSSNFVILDVRTEDEYQEFHIKGAVNIPDFEIRVKAKDVLPDKDQLIFVYCRSGRRSRLAAVDLINLGYTNIVEFGGIIDWPYELE